MFLDTSAMIASLSQGATHGAVFDALVARGVRFQMSALVLHEWRRGPRTPAELELQRALLPDAAALPFTHLEAELASRYYRTLPRARSRVMDFCIAAGAVSCGELLWTLNREDFEDIPGLRLARL